MIYLCNRKPHSNEKEQSTTMCNITDKIADIMFQNISQIQKNTCFIISFIRGSKTGKANYTFDIQVVKARIDGGYLWGR